MLQFIMFSDLDISPMRNLHLAYKYLDNSKRTVILFLDSHSTTQTLTTRTHTHPYEHL
jgi:hypothetical protein